ncbi:hypothetical protein SDC9_166093 [bioreactor metagenome]|uniref:Uncharacterized protein n=1 Tax=bioreactor metagenome TaxID=1076179 RepID=A0A645FYL5_9ZZZZ
MHNKIHRKARPRNGHLLSLAHVLLGFLRGSAPTVPAFPLLHGIGHMRENTPVALILKEDVFDRFILSLPRKGIDNFVIPIHPFLPQRAALTYFPSK